MHFTWGLAILGIYGLSSAAVGLHARRVSRKRLPGRPEELARSPVAVVGIGPDARRTCGARTHRRWPPDRRRIRGPVF
jgi:hypothetical protein